MMKNVFITTIILLLLFSNCMTTYAINSGFELEPISNDKELLIRNNIDISVFEQEMLGNAIECFDVNDDGMIALGTDNSSQKFISIYNSHGVFQYGYQFNCSGNFGIEWDANNIIICFVRSDIVCSINPNGEIEEIMSIKNTLGNDSYWNNQVYSTTRVVGDAKYRIKNDFGMLNIFSTSYSQLVIQDYNEKTKIIYDVNSQQLSKLIMTLLCILSFAILVISIIVKECKHRPIKTQVQSGDGSVIDNSSND